MLIRTHRFHGRTSLAYVYRQGRTVRAQHLGLRFARNSKRSEYRAAVIVSRKIHKSAVARNRLRRRIYEIIRVGKPITGPYDLVITAYSDQASELAPRELQKQVWGLLAKAGIYRQDDVQPSIDRAIVRQEKV